MEFYEFTDFYYPEKKVLINKNCIISSIHWSNNYFVISVCGDRYPFSVSENEKEIMAILNGDASQKT